jgi:hypothetical protein
MGKQMPGSQESTSARDVALAFAREHADDVVELTKQLIAAPSPNLPGD